jgi:hypothetical protein
MIFFLILHLYEFFAFLCFHIIKIQEFVKNIPDFFLKFVDLYERFARCCENLAERYKE